MASPEPYLGSVDLWPLSWAPDGWLLCQGQLLPINQYSALFALLGTTYGGNGSSNFAIPNMQGRVALGAGTSPVSGAVYSVGQTGGAETVTLKTENIPIHTHLAAGTVKPKAGTGKITLTNDPTNNYPGQAATSTLIYTTTNNAQMGESPVTVTVQNTGGSIPFSTMPPYLVLNYMIAITGIFPTRP